MSCCGGSPPDEAFQELAASLPITVRTPGEIPSVPFKQHHDRRLLGCIISELDPNFVHRPLHIKGPSPHTKLTVSITSYSTWHWPPSGVV